MISLWFYNVQELYFCYENIDYILEKSAINIKFNMI